MKQKIITLALASILSLGVVLPVVANSTETEALNRANDLREQNQARSQNIHNQAETQAQHREDAMQHACERVQTAMQFRDQRIKAVMQKHLEFMDTLFLRLQNYVDENNLQVEKYQELVEEVELAQSEAADAVENFAEENQAIDCSSGLMTEEIQSHVHAFRGNVVEVVAALKDYRQALRALLQAVKEAASSAEGQIHSGGGE